VTTADSEALSVTVDRGPRGRVWLYAIAFVLLLVSGLLQAKGNLHSQLRLVRISIGLSAGAALLAIASVLVPGRRVREAKPEAEVANEAEYDGATDEAEGGGAADQAEHDGSADEGRPSSAP
jgi:hypothetical protein